MSQDATNPDVRAFGQQVLVLQGGGALGAYQVGVYQALDQAGIDLDWVVGTSIGAINAAIIAGSPRSDILTMSSSGSPLSL
jgi:NTE family protein